MHIHVLMPEDSMGGADLLIRRFRGQYLAQLYFLVQLEDAGNQTSHLPITQTYIRPFRCTMLLYYIPVVTWKQINHPVLFIISVLMMF